MTDAGPDAELRTLIAELNAAEKQQLEDEGPLTDRLHRAIAALCAYVDIPNAWDTER